MFIVRFISVLFSVKLKSVIFNSVIFVKSVIFQVILIGSVILRVIFVRFTGIGLIGLLAFLAMIIGAGLLIYRAILIIKKTNLEQRRQYEQYLLAGAGALAVIFIHGLVDVHYFKNDLSILFWLVMGLIVINYNLLSSKEA